MRFGALIRGMTIDEIIENVAGYRDAGYASAWLTDGVGMEPLTVLAAVGRTVPGIELGTAVVRTYPRHPMALAQQALTVNAMIGGRLTLGVGPSHKPSIEGSWGIAFEQPVRHVREYLSVLGPLLAGDRVDFEGETLAAHSALHIEDGVGVPVLVGALGPKMLDLAGAMADGAITFMAGPRTLVDLTCPTIRAAAMRAGRADPRVVAMVSVCVTDDLAAVQARAQRAAESMAHLPSYAAMLRREGGPALIAGPEDEVVGQLQALEAAGVSDLIPVPVAKRDSEDERRTGRLLHELRRASSSDNG